jgi:hypothetical protein
MRCKGCDYALFEIAARACPECGLPFKPSDFDFTLNSVRFCCPHCRQAYFGTDTRGHLQPRRFVCVSCANEIDMDDMIVATREEVPEAVTVPDRMPWFERRRIGVVSAFFATIWRSMINPVRLAGTLPAGPASVRSASTLSGLWFATLVVALTVAIGTSAMFVLPAGMGVTAGAGGGMLFGVAVTALFMFVVPLLVALALIALWVLGAHAILRVTGTTRGGLASTFDSIGFSSGVVLPAIIPCVGWMILPFVIIWWVIVAVVMLAKAQAVEGWRAALACAGPPVTMLLVSVALVVIGTYAMPTLPAIPPPAAPVVVTPGIAAGPNGTSQAMVSARAALISRAIEAFRAERGQWPTHGIDLVASGHVTASRLVQDFTADTTFGSMALSDLDYIERPRVEAIAQASVADLVPPTNTHRVGDTWFLFGGLPHDLRDDTVWAAIVADGLGGCVIITTDGGTTPRGMPDEDDIAEQNAYRASLGLPALPAAFE